MAASLPTGVTNLDLSARWVRVTGTRGNFVEFNFTLADPMLTIELILPYHAFVEFQREHGAVMEVENSVKDQFARLARPQLPHPHTA